MSKKHPSLSSLVAVAHESDFTSLGEIMKVVCPDTKRVVITGEVGELWISCPSKASGYFGQPKLSNEVFHATLIDNDDNKTYL